MNDRFLGDPAKILLVEDNPGAVRLIEETFREGKIANSLHVATDGTEALDFVFQRGEFTDAPRPDIILLDLDLPDINGDEVLDELKSDPDLQHVPVVVLTGSRAQTNVAKSHGIDADAFITKPVEPEEFIELVQSFDHLWLTVDAVPDAEEA